MLGRDVVMTLDSGYTFVLMVSAYLVVYGSNIYLDYSLRELNMAVI